MLPGGRATVRGMGGEWNVNSDVLDDEFIRRHEALEDIIRRTTPAPSDQPQPRRTPTRLSAEQVRAQLAASAPSKAPPAQDRTEQADAEVATAQARHAARQEALARQAREAAVKEEATRRTNTSRQHDWEEYDPTDDSASQYDATCANQGCPRSRYTDYDGTVHDFCSPACAAQHARNNPPPPPPGTACALHGCRKSAHVDAYTGMKQPYCSRICELADHDRAHAYDQPAQPLHPLPTDPLARSAGPLITKAQAETSPNIMTTLLVALGLNPDDKRLRPNLWMCVLASGHDPSSPTWASQWTSSWSTSSTPTTPARTHSSPSRRP